MELRVLEYFLTVADEGSITAASKRLHVTQPTLSRQLHDLEQELGQKLFIRGSHTMTLTHEGVRLRRHAEKMITLRDQVEEEFRDMGHNAPGDVYFGAAESYTMELVAQAFKSAQQVQSNLKLHLRSGNAAYITGELDAGTIDFGILSQPANAGKYNFFELPLHDEWVFICRRDHKLAGRKAIRPKDLVDEPLIMSRQGSKKNVVGSNLTAWFGDYFRKINTVVDFSLPYNAGIMVQQGVGSLITFDRIINTTSTSDLVAIPLDPPVYAGLAVCWCKERELSPAAELLLSHMKEQFGNTEAQTPWM